MKTKTNLQFKEHASILDTHNLEKTLNFFLILDKDYTIVE
jgi:hypothetical protein